MLDYLGDEEVLEGDDLFRGRGIAIEASNKNQKPVKNCMRRPNKSQIKPQLNSFCMRTAVVKLLGLLKDLTVLKNHNKTSIGEIKSCKGL